MLAPNAPSMILLSGQSNTPTKDLQTNVTKDYGYIYKNSRCAVGDRSVRWQVLSVCSFHNLMKIILSVFEDEDARPEVDTPVWSEEVFSVAGAEEALGRLESYLTRHPLKESNDEIPF